ncbi:AraC family transcriptional regulator [Limnohabitans lacus]|uniref:AraC family transcriptional regulator ligand-binding domain-containing protein n=1 Tax=Limnohabitans lacus TaxID=3045173 RepID=A0ABT6X7Y5_9BURK|nr:AraC family transcriptional regulator [Limnohabitans sp. HM2-2]MDI9234252.1 AraC family transcriptional regulator ligand-binding domain-containing protein [Limnohabitans sp. HM2-2]
MKQATRFAVQMSWKLLILDMGYAPSDVLSLARLPGDLFARPGASLSPAQYFDLWRGLEQAAGHDELALKLAQVMSVEAFDPALFACLCSPDLNTALQRLAHYKRLIGPLHMEVDIRADRTQVSLRCYGSTAPIPRSLGVSELVFFTQLARLATRERIEPLAASVPDLPLKLAPYQAYLGCALGASEQILIAFSADDARRPFLTDNMAMWAAFEPGLKQRLSELDAQAKMRERVRAVLLETLPAGISSIDAVAKRLALSKRSLQRQLADESVGFQELLSEVRQELARHYLSRTDISAGEISWLLGFQESNSFIRAFRSWTGTTPAAYRLGRVGMDAQWH